MAKKKWLRPMVTVLVKGKIEEKVLVDCKSVTSAGTQGSVQNVCATPNCMACTVPSTS